MERRHQGGEDHDSGPLHPGRAVHGAHGRGVQGQGRLSCRLGLVGAAHVGLAGAYLPSGDVEVVQKLTSFLGETNIKT